MLTKHPPQRTCIACRSVRDKPDMVRLVCTPAGAITVDIKGKMAGRGAYLCPEWRCWEAGLKSNRIEHALHGRLSAEDRDTLTKFAKELGANSG